MTKTQFIFGKHPVRTALEGERAVHKLWLSKTLKPHIQREFRQLAKTHQVPVQIVDPKKLKELGPEGIKQGIVAEIRPYDFMEWPDFERKIKAETAPFVLILDQIQDPHNLGAIIRTADAAGVHGIVIPKHGAVGLTETVGKASVGAIERVPVIRETNLARCLEQLKALGLWIYGLSLEAKAEIYQTKLEAPIALVVGNEHKGLRPNVAKHCDQLVKIPMHSNLQSLNASVSAALVMYEVVRQGRIKN